MKDPLTSAKRFWSILKAILNNTFIPFKTPFIPPLLSQNKNVIDFP